MIKSITFENVINYRDRQEMHFEEGANFIVGGNSTGKSSILELIRRCHRLKLSTSVSSVLNEDKPAYIISTYCGCNQLLQKLTEEFSSLDTDKMLTCVFYDFKDTRQESNQAQAIRQPRVFKIVCLKEKSETNRILIAATEYESNQGRLKKKKNFNLQVFPCEDQEVQIFVRKYLKDSKNSDNSQNSDTDSKLKIEFAFLRKVQGYLETASDSEHQFSTKKILEYFIPAYVSVFPVRSAGPMQWTRSKFLDPKDERASRGEEVPNDNSQLGSRNYRAADDRSEILQSLLPDVDRVEVDEIDTKKENQYFKAITHPIVYDFKRSSKNKSITVTNCQAPKENKDFPLLKAPEGVVEAKQASLIFSQKLFKTICYEDLDKAMHHQMVENMAHLVLKNIRGKVIIIVTHNQSFINGWSIKRTHVCSRERISGGNFIHVVRKVLDSTKCGVHDEIKKTLIASNVLLVEGISDLQIIRSFFNFITSNDLEKVAKTLERLEEDIIYAVACTQIVVSGGKTNLTNIRDFCRQIAKPVMVLVDRDAIKWLESNGYHQMPPKSELHYWKTGEIEDAIRKDCTDRYMAGLLTVTEESLRDSWADKKENSDSTLKKKFKSKILTFNDDEYCKLFKSMIQTFDTKDHEFRIFLEFVLNFCRLESKK